MSLEPHNIKRIGLQDWILSGKEAVWRLGREGGAGRVPGPGAHCKQQQRGQCHHQGDGRLKTVEVKSF